VHANAALTGAGAVGNTVIGSGGIFLPGNGTPGSSMTVSGNLAFQSGALYLVQLNSTTSTFANVTGTAALNGTVGASFTAGSIVLPRYTILTAAGGHSGSFAGVDTLGLPAGFVATLSYDPTHAYLNFVLDYGARSNLSVNQQNVNKTLGNFFIANGGIPGAFGGLSSAGLSQISGETATGSQQATFDAMNIFLGLLTDPFVAAVTVLGPLPAALRRSPRRSTASTPMRRSSRPPRARRSPNSPPRRRSRPICSILAGVCGARPMAAAAPPTAMLRWDPILPQRARSASSPAPTTAFRRRRWPGLRWPAAVPVLASTASVPGARTCSRPAHSCATMSVRPM